MKYCPRCGVSIDLSIERCPVCMLTQPVYDEFSAQPSSDGMQAGGYPPLLHEPLLRGRINQEYIKKLVLFSLGSFCAFLIFVTTLIDFMVSQRISWSIFVSVPSLAIFLGVAVGLSRLNWIIKAVLWGVGAMQATETILVVAFPVFAHHLGVGVVWLESFIFAQLLLFLLFGKSERRMYRLSTLFAPLLLSYLLILDATFEPIGWSLIVVASVLPLYLWILYIIFASRRGYNLVAAFFLALALLFVGLAYTTVGALSWALIPSAIALFIACVFFLLQYVLMRDIDVERFFHI